MQPATWNKAWVGGIAAPILNWLIGILAAWTLSLGYSMPDAVQAALVALLTGVLIYFVPNADPKPTEADRIKELEDQIARLQAGAGMRTVSPLSPMTPLPAVAISGVNAP